MALQLQIFQYKEEDRFSNVRTIDIDGEIWWVAKDVCGALGIKDHHQATSRLDNDERGRYQIPTPFGNQEMLCINEPGLYSLIIRSDKPEAKKFKRWVTHEVLPRIRKTGSYSVYGPGVPVFVRRFNDNWDRVDRGYFSIISELFIRVYGRLEQVGYQIPDKAIKTNKEIRPDVSVGKLFPKWLRKKYPDKADNFKEYSHIFPNGLEVPARQYPNNLLSEFIEFVETEWIPHHAERYLSERDPKALGFLPKLIMYRKVPEIPK